MTEKQFTVDDVTYSYIDLGEANKETIVLLHGFTGSKLTWSPFFSELQNHFRIIAIDMPGHGKTTQAKQVTMEVFSDHLHKLLEKENCSEIHLLGYSMGGRSALSFAILHGHMVKTLILESASPGLKTEGERKSRQERDMALAQTILTKGIVNFVKQWEKVPLFDSQKFLPQTVQEQIRQGRLSQDPVGLSHSLEYMGTGVQPSWWNSLSQLNTKTLLITGEVDEKFVQINKEMEKLLPQSSLEVINGTGHAIHVEQREKFVKLVIDFIKNEKGLST